MRIQKLSLITLGLVVAVTLSAVGCKNPAVKWYNPTTWKHMNDRNNDDSNYFADDDITLPSNNARPDINPMHGGYSNNSQMVANNTQNPVGMQYNPNTQPNNIQYRQDNIPVGYNGQQNVVHNPAPVNNVYPNNGSYYPNSSQNTQNPVSNPNSSDVYYNQNVPVSATVPNPPYGSNANPNYTPVVPNNTVDYSNNNYNKSSGYTPGSLAY